MTGRVFRSSNYRLLVKPERPVSREVHVEAARDPPGHLGELGLDVEKVVGNKVVGSILAGKLPKLEGDDSVRLVE